MRKNGDFMLTILGIGAMAILLGFNIRHALNDYGITEGNLHVEILAQSNSSGGGSGSGSSSGSGSNNYGGGSSGSGSGGGSNPWYEWPSQGTTKDEYSQSVPCTWNWEIDLVIFKWGESGSGKKKKCYNGGKENCSVGSCD